MHAKYHGKGVMVLGKAALDFNPDPSEFTPEGKYQYFSLGGVACKLEQASKDKFVRIKKGAIVAV